MNQQTTPAPVPLKSVPVEQFRIEQLNNWSAAVPFGQRKLRILAASVLILIFGFGGVWASTAKLGGATVGVGRVIAAGNNRMIQHLEGGILSKIMIKVGDVVTAGMPVAELDTTQNRSQYEAALNQRVIYTAELERWRAEIAGADDYVVAPALLAPLQDSPRVQEAVQNYHAEFIASLAVKRKLLSMLDAKIEATSRDIESQHAGIVGLDEQYELIKLEYTDLAKLLKSGLTARPRVLALERTMSRIDAQRTMARFAISKGHSDITSMREEKEKVTLEYSENANKNLSRVQKEINSLQDVAGRLADRLDRAIIRAPSDGVVFRVYKMTEGSVLGPGESFAEIFPDREELNVEVAVQPKDISSVFKGQDVEVVFESDQRAKLTPLDGTVQYISTDTVIDEASGRVNFIVRATIKKNQGDRRILPGNTAEIYFTTEPKTFFQILAEPLTRFAFRSFTG